MNYFCINNIKKQIITSPAQESLKFMHKSIEKQLKEKYPSAKQTNIDDFIYFLFREVVISDSGGNEIFPRIPPRERRPILSALFAKNYGIKQIQKEINNYWFYIGIQPNRNNGKMTVATIMMLETTCFLEAEPNCNVAEEQYADMIKQIIQPGQWKKFAEYAIETNNPVMCQVIRNHFELTEKYQDKLDAVLVAAKLVEIG